MSAITFYIYGCCLPKFLGANRQWANRQHGLPRTGSPKVLAQARPKPGPGQISVNGQISGNLGTWQSGNLESQNKHKNIKNLKIEICVAQNVGKGWISRRKQLPALFGAISGKNAKTRRKSCLLSLVGQCALFIRFGVI